MVFFLRFGGKKEIVLHLDEDKTMLFFSKTSAGSARSDARMPYALRFLWRRRHRRDGVGERDRIEILRFGTEAKATGSVFGKWQPAN
jgi:hypothetical protein